MKASRGTAAAPQERRRRSDNSPAAAVVTRLSAPPTKAAAAGSLVASGRRQSQQKKESIERSGFSEDEPRRGRGRADNTTPTHRRREGRSLDWMRAPAATTVPRGDVRVGDVARVEGGAPAAHTIAPHTVRLWLDLLVSAASKLRGPDTPSAGDAQACTAPGAVLAAARAMDSLKDQMMETVSRLEAVGNDTFTPQRRRGGSRGGAVATASAEDSTADELREALRAHHDEAAANERALLQRLELAEARVAALEREKTLEFTAIEGLVSPTHSRRGDDGAPAPQQSANRNHTGAAPAVDDGAWASRSREMLSTLQEDYEALETQFIATLAAHQQASAQSTQEQTRALYRQLVDACGRERALLLVAEAEARATLRRCCYPHAEHQQAELPAGPHHRPFAATATAAATATRPDTSATAAAAAAERDDMEILRRLRPQALKERVDAGAVCTAPPPSAAEPQQTAGPDGLNDSGVAARVARRRAARSRTATPPPSRSSHHRDNTRGTVDEAPWPWSAITPADADSHVAPISPLLLYDADVQAEVRALLLRTRDDLQHAHDRRVAALEQQHEVERHLWGQRLAAQVEEYQQLLRHAQRLSAEVSQLHTVNVTIGAEGWEGVPANVRMSASDDAPRRPMGGAPAPTAAPPEAQDDDFGWAELGTLDPGPGEEEEGEGEAAEGPASSEGTAQPHSSPRDAGLGEAAFDERAYRDAMEAASAAVLDLKLQNEHLQTKNRILRRELDDASAPTPQSLLGSPYVLAGRSTTTTPLKYESPPTIYKQQQQQHHDRGDSTPARDFTDMFRPDQLPPYPPRIPSPAATAQTSVNPAIWVVAQCTDSLENDNDNNKVQQQHHHTQATSAAAVGAPPPAGNVGKFTAQRRGDASEESSYVLAPVEMNTASPDSSSARSSESSRQGGGVQ